LLSNVESVESTASKYLSKIEKKEESSESESEEDKEKKEKLQDILNYICATSTSNSEQAIPLLDEEKVEERYSKPVESQPSTQFLDEDSPVHTSDEEVNSQFLEDLARLLNLSHLLPNNQNGRSLEASQKSADDQFKNK
jgi:hypothetical protein